jgi:hypothetical protein
MTKRIASAPPEPVEIELRSPTVVLSVRLDEATAKALHRIARQRGLKLSDVLRDAAVTYARYAADEPSRSVAYLDQRVGVGSAAARSEGRIVREQAVSYGPESPWDQGPTTTVAASESRRS